MPFKTVRQDFVPNHEELRIMEVFREMVNHCIEIGLKNNCSTLKKLSNLSYNKLKEYDILSYYKLTAISQAAGRLAQRRRDIKRGITPKSPCVKKPYLTSCYGFKIREMLLSFPIRNREFANVLLNEHTVKSLFGKSIKPRSFTITPTSLSISVQKDVTPIAIGNVIGIDRNLRNITISTPDQILMYKTNKILSIKENTMRVIASFKRNDRRLKGKFYAQKRNRQTRRVNQHLHKISKDIVQRAIQTKSMIVFENLTGIRKMYRKGNGQGKKYRRRLNSWSFYELQRQVEYKAAWEGIPVKFVDPKRTSMLCPICGGRLQEDRQNRRKSLCTNCMKSMDRDVVASLNIAYKGWARFTHPRGLSSEAVKGNPDLQNLVILRVDGSKLLDVYRHKLTEPSKV